MDAQHRQLHILVAIDEVPDPCWGILGTLAAVRFERDGLGAYRALAAERFDMVFVDLYLTGMDSLELLRRIHAERLCADVVLTSPTPSFSYAQQGILYGVSAYLLRPLESGEVLQAVQRHLQRSSVPDPALWDAARSVTARLREEDAAQVFSQVGSRLEPPARDAMESGMRWRDLYENVVRQTFRLYPWFALYHAPAEYEALDFVRDTEGGMVESFTRRKLARLSGDLRFLFPRGKRDTLEEILLLLLENVDGNLQQKDVAARFFITSSTLSTRFQRHLGLSYRSYMTRLKIARGQYLLQYTPVSAGDLAGRLGYRDKDHFARIFERQTGRTLQECGQKLWGGEYEI